MFFCDFLETGVVYHIAPINDFKKILERGIGYKDKVSYKSKYIEFHNFLDSFRTSDIPDWVERQKAIFASMNFKKHPCFHAHSVILAVKVYPERCWIANENRGNQLYEPFILKDIKEFRSANHYLNTKGAAMALQYWKTSLSFQDNIKKRMDLVRGYDAEVMIFHPIPPEDIKPLFIVSDHRILTIDQWRRIFCI
ncbi:hypothetical protein [Alkaliphilus serpentinus]|uniref:DUF4433 domain-containing protein n=1 Tax=Alkaliphilus serpentinus TaxID=1482731 RepID=A0A833HNW8_9FIRM|nr:hypothetical protein [Alkaliphilus serpentinus]KAB3530023.1 hypothetical protein F8153_07960 [Alkaliphilus serpentinus]